MNCAAIAGRRAIAGDDAFSGAHYAIAIISLHFKCHVYVARAIVFLGVDAEARHRLSPSSRMLHRIIIDSDAMTAYSFEMLVVCQCHASQCLENKGGIR